MEARPAGRGRPDRTALLIAFTVLLGLTVALIALSIPAGLYAVFSGRLSTAYGPGSSCANANTIVCNYFWVGPVVRVLPFAVSSGGWFALFTGIYAVLILYSVRARQGPLKAIAAAFSQEVESLAKSPFLVVVMSIGFLTFGASMIDLAVSSTGTPIGGPSGDPLALLVGLTYSPLVEEVGFRVILIGTVALVLSLRRPLKAALASLWRPSKAMEGLAVGSGASIIIWAAMGFSAFTFGACHVACGGSTWDIGKFPEAAFGGLVLGYLYVRYGFHAAVLAHWGVNFFGSVYAFFGQAAYGIPWNSGAGEFLGQYLVDVDMLFLFGLLSFVLVLYLGIRRLARRPTSPPVGEFKDTSAGEIVEP